ncbi:MAG: lysostaphin resistance A-like protein [Lachnospiraceae bacterium]
MKTGKVIAGSVFSIFILIFSQIVSELFASLLHVIGLHLGFCNIIAGLCYLFCSYFLIKVFANKFLKLDLDKLKMSGFKIKIRWMIIAFVLPICVKVIYLLLPGAYVLTGMDGNEIFVTLSTGIVFTGLAAGFVEEMVFRGVIMNLLMERWGKKVAIIVPSLLFGAVHIIGMNYSLFSCMLVLVAGTMVGVMFSLIMLESNSVWNNGIVHAIWNIVIIGGGLCVSQEPDQYSIITYVLQSKSFALTGGEFGIESSVIALAGYVVVSLLAWNMMKRQHKND